MGFLPADDARGTATVQAVRDQLEDDGLLYRYLDSDGLPGREGAFLPCIFWLAEVLALRGEQDETHEVFERAIGCANDVGLLAEEADPATGAALGNFAQAFSHLALIHAAVRLAEAGRKTDVTREQRRDGWRRRLLAGAAAGIGATVPMTAVMAAAQRAGWLSELPPETITAAAADAADVELDEPERHGLSALNHLAFGASCGAGFAVLARRVPPGSPRVATGAAFGIIVWLASYQGWLPALDVLPPASRDHRGRRHTMIAAHVVYGATLGALLRS